MQGLTREEANKVVATMSPDEQRHLLISACIVLSEHAHDAELRKFSQHLGLIVSAKRYDFLNKTMTPSIIRPLMAQAMVNT